VFVSAPVPPPQPLNTTAAAAADAWQRNRRRFITSISTQNLEGSYHAQAPGSEYLKTTPDTLLDGAPAAAERIPAELNAIPLGSGVPDGSTENVPPRTMPLGSVLARSSV